MSLQSYQRVMVSLCLTGLPFALDMLLKKQPGYLLVIVLSPLKALMENQVCFFFFCLYAYVYDCYICMTGFCSISAKWMAFSQVHQFHSVLSPVNIGTIKFTKGIVICLY